MTKKIIIHTVAVDVGSGGGLHKPGVGLCEISWGHDDYALVRSLVQKKNRRNQQCRARKKNFANNCLLKHQVSLAGTPTAYNLTQT